MIRVRAEIVELVRGKTRRLGLHDADLLTQELQQANAWTELAVAAEIVRKELGLPMLTGGRPQ